MGKVITHMTMSLDGYIADPDDQVGELFDWYQAGDVKVQHANQELGEFNVDEASATTLGDLLEGGALIAGRHLFDIANGWNDAHPTGARVVVVTHERARGCRRTVAQDDLRRRGRGGRRQGEGARREWRRHDRQPDHHPAGTGPRPGGRGGGEPRPGAVRRGEILFRTSWRTDT